MTKTVSAMYDSYAAADRAVRDLEKLGVPADQISLVAHDKAQGRVIHTEESDAGKAAGAAATAGALVGGGAGLLAGIGALAIPGVGPVVAAGWLISTLTGAGAGAALGAAGGGLVGSMIENDVPEDQAHVYAESVRRGGCVVIAKVADDLAGQADSILQNSDFVDAQARGQIYRNAGWDRFDAGREPLTQEQLDRERHLDPSGTI